ncbi:MAG: hypothetical protein IPL35_17565 [Sphingobacteriales bacterium]|nr:hypothetical protein [Sphingobacteriales bacterium]
MAQTIRFRYISQAFNVIESPDGGYVLSGNTRTEPEWDGNTDMQLLKTDSFGNMQWEKKIGKADNWDCGALVAPLNDSTFLLHGCFGNSTLVEVKPSTMYIAHLHYDDGSVVYENQYETQLKYGVNSFHGQPLMLANNDYIGVASTDNELNERIASIIKHNQWGEVLWQKFLTVNADKMTYLKDIERTADGGFVACGFQYEPPQFAWVVKLDSLGNTAGK